VPDPADLWRTAFRHPTPWEQDFPPLSLPDMFEASARRVPNAWLIDFMGRKYSYAETLHGVNRVACGLAKLGIQKGDRVGLFLPNVPHYAAAYYGALKLGATVVNFSPLYSVAELVAQVEDSGTRLLFTLSAAALLPNALELLELTRLERLVVGSVAGALPPAKSLLYRLFKRKEIAARPRDQRIMAFSALIANDGRCSAVPIDPVEDLALIQYTGGTTGTPKGGMLTHQNLSANASQVNAIDPDPAAEDRIMGVLPLFHVFANTCVLNRTVLRGGEMVLLPRFDAGQTLAAIERTRPTAMPGVPTMYQALLDHPKIGSTDLSSLRICISGGAPMPSEVKRRFEEKTGARLVEGYGLTESSGVVSTNPYDGLNKTGTIGQPLPRTLVLLVDKEDPSRPPAEGEPGEIVIAGPQVMKGYWRRPEADAEVFVAGGLRTGDVGLIDEDGYIRIVDRLKDMIAVSGYKVFPSQIEEILYRHESVREALVIGIPDPYAGERPKAFVTLRDGADLSGEALMLWLNPLLGKHERVVAVELRDALPKTMIGKLSRKELQAEERAKAGSDSVSGINPDRGGITPNRSG
jgi:long-chain acyl-CoA synthetase